MSAMITTGIGEAVPPASCHSVTFHMGSGWASVERWADDAQAVLDEFKSVYPRMRPHGHVADLAAAVLRFTAQTGQDDAQLGCFLFASLRSAQECVEYATSSRRGEGGDGPPVAAADMAVWALAAKDPFFAVTFPLGPASRVLAGFWTTPGVGVSSRFAQANLGLQQRLRQLPMPADDGPGPRPACFEGPSHAALRRRILECVERAPRDPGRGARPAADDIYLFPTGMASMYKPHTYLLGDRPGTTVLFGMAFTNTLDLFDDFGPGFSFLGHATDEDLARLEALLRHERSQGRRVQAIWAEAPSNPLLVTPDVAALRRLADEHDAVLAIDDTIGGWANTDLASAADLVVTSLTKSFNGYADAMAGCAVLNPASPQYRRLKRLFRRNYIAELYADDAAAIERNSRDYLARTARLNQNASAMAAYLHRCAADAASAVVRVYHPSVGPSRGLYERLMRPPTPDFTPGYGCLLSVELDDMPATRAFYEQFNVHKGAHLGAPRTIALAYTACVYAKRLDWAASHGLRPTQIRISAGLEDTDALLGDLRLAVEAANACRGAG